MLRVASISLAILWMANLCVGGPTLLWPGRFALSLCCGMLVLDEDALGSSGLHIAWCPPKVIEDMGPPAPFLPFSRTKPLSIHTLSRGATLGIPLWPLVFACGLCTWWVWRMQEQRAKRGQCLLCGRNRAGLAYMSPCPECGAIPGYRG